MVRGGLLVSVERGMSDTSSGELAEGGSSLDSELWWFVPRSQKYQGQSVQKTHEQGYTSMKLFFHALSLTVLSSTSLVGWTWLK